MLQLTNVHVAIDDTPILRGFSHEFTHWNNYCIVGKNGSGKSSLALTVMGHPDYEVSQWTIEIDGEDLLEMEPNERAKAWIFLAFQTIPEVKGVKLFEFLRTIYNATHDVTESFVSFKKIVLPILEELNVDKEFLWRELNVGFSGGERRKIEIVQLRLLKPKYVILDEVDSGLDVDAFRSVASLLKTLDSDEMTFIIITHYFTILDYLPVDEVIIMEDGVVTHTGWVELAETVRDQGFAALPTV